MILALRIGRAVSLDWALCWVWWLVRGLVGRAWFGACGPRVGTVWFGGYGVILPALLRGAET